MMDWMSFWFGVVTGVTTIMLVGFVAFMAMLRPYIKEVRSKKKRKAYPGDDEWINYWINQGWKNKWKQ